MGQILDNVRALYMEGIRDGRAREAVEKYTGDRYTQHSTGVGNGVEGFVTFFEGFLERTPVRHIEIVRAFEDGRHAFVQAYQSLNGGEAKWVTMDLFDTDAEGRIIEHWDVIEAFAEQVPSGAGMVEGASDVDESVDTTASKGLVREYIKQVVQQGEHDKLDHFVSPDLIQHSPRIAAGRDGLRDHLASEASGDYEMLFMLIGQGNFVATLGKAHVAGQDHAVIDLYRVENGQIAEHWDVDEPILERGQWGNSGKF